MASVTITLDDIKYSSNTCAGRIDKGGRFKPDGLYGKVVFWDKRSNLSEGHWYKGTFRITEPENGKVGFITPVKVSKADTTMEVEYKPNKTLSEAMGEDMAYSVNMCEYVGGRCIYSKNMAVTSFFKINFEGENKWILDTNYTDLIQKFSLDVNYLVRCSEMEQKLREATREAKEINDNIGLTIHTKLTLDNIEWCDLYKDRINGDVRLRIKPSSPIAYTNHAVVAYSGGRFLIKEEPSFYSGYIYPPLTIQKDIQEYTGTEVFRRHESSVRDGDYDWKNKSNSTNWYRTYDEHITGRFRKTTYSFSFEEKYHQFVKESDIEECSKPTIDLIEKHSSVIYEISFERN